MVPKVAGTGRSFVGAGLYYLHDKKASTKERVAFTHTENLPTRDPDKAIKCMAYTAIRQAQIKARAGGSTKGRKLEQPVYCYSLSWAPDQNPSQDEMIDAAKESLRLLGLSEHETLFVGHNDEPHPHIHVIVNRVHPETGVAAKLSKDFLRLSEWAEEFERRHGGIRCEQRVENNALRRQGEFVKDRDSQNAAEFHRWRMDRVASQHDKRAVEGAVLDARHERERDQLRIARDRRIDDQRKRVRTATRADWRDLYSIQRQETTRLDAAQKNAWTRVRFFLKTHGPEYKAAGKAGRREMLKGAIAALIGSKSQYAKLEHKQKTERVFFADKLKKHSIEFVARTKKEHERELSELVLKQSAEIRDMRKRHAEQSEKQAREIRDGRDKEIFRQERRDKLHEKLKETKEEIERTREQKTAPKPSLSKRFKQAALDPTAARDRAADVKPSTADRKPRVSRQDEFKEQAKDVTERTARPTRSGGLSEKFRKARDEKPAEQQRGQKQAEFRDNAKDTGRDFGRERSRTPKPPGHKPK